MASIVNLNKEKQSHVFFIAEYYKYWNIIKKYLI
jgi:hypothetical protein